MIKNLWQNNLLKSSILKNGIGIEGQKVHKQVRSM